MKHPYCITFAGVVGSSKTPIAHHLSWKLGLPVFSNDILRTEVREDLLRFDQDEYVRRRNERSQELITSGRSFIYDASIDREWPRLSEWLQTKNYQHFIISLDLSRELLNKLYEAKGYAEGHRLEELMSQHESFLADYGGLVGAHVTDANFDRRLEVSLAAVGAWFGDGE
jgi:predicted kinase